MRIATEAAVFLDRDGTLNVECAYLHRIEDFEWIAGAPEAIRRFNDANYLVVVITNQAGVARGFYDTRAVERLHAYMRKLLLPFGARIDAFYYCPHHPDFGPPCECRKPGIGMIQQAAQEWNIDLAASWLVGDKLLDIEAARAAGVKPVLVRTGYGAEHEARLQKGVPVVTDIGAAAIHICSALKI